jgi:aryl sulfotransferase
VLQRAPIRRYKTWAFESARWDSWKPRPDDIIICTYPKCGTTWMQRIVSLLVFQTTEPRSIPQASPWLEHRFREPLETIMDRIERQSHRRFLKSHVPLDGLPVHDDVRYIHVARDGRDACLSFHNHCLSFTPDALANMDRVGYDDPDIGRPFPRAPADPAAFFHQWLNESIGPEEQDGSPALSFFNLEATYWRERQRKNLLLVHYRDLKRDLEGEMRRVAEFIGVDVASDLWPALVEAAGIDAMRRDGDLLMPHARNLWQGGARQFFYKGENERWRGLFAEADLDMYQTKIEARLSPAGVRWLAEGRGERDPRIIGED